jgi:hypothetical protein
MEEIPVRNYVSDDYVCKPEVKGDGELTNSALEIK